MSTITVIARIVAKKESLDSVKAQLLALVDPSRNDEGCIEYRLHQSNDDPAVFVFYEQWENEDILAKHMDTAHFKAFAEAVEGATEDITVHKLTQLA